MTTSQQDVCWGKWHWCPGLGEKSGCLFPSWTFDKGPAVCCCFSLPRDLFGGSVVDEIPGPEASSPLLGPKQCWVVSGQSGGGGWEMSGFGVRSPV